jgi:hypothetical protein
MGRAARVLAGRRALPAGYPGQVRCLNGPVRGVRPLGVLLAGALGASACGGLPPAKVYGDPGYRFAIAFTRPPTEQAVSVSTSMGRTQYGTTVARRVLWSGGGPDVWVFQLTNPVPPNRVDGFLRSYFPTSDGGRIVSRFGLPAGTESVACSTPAGPCPGNVAVLDVLSATTLYEVFARLDASTDQAIISSFRLVG